MPVDGEEKMLFEPAVGQLAGLEGPGVVVVAEEVKDGCERVLEGAGGLFR